MGFWGSVGPAAMKAGKFGMKGLGPLSVLLMLGLGKDLIGELVDEDLSLKALFTGVTDKDEKRFAEQVAKIAKQRKKRNVTMDLLSESFGPRLTALERAAPQDTDIVEMEALRSIIPLAARSGMSADEILGEQGPESIFGALRPKERKAVSRAVKQPVMTSDQVIEEARRGL